MHVVYGVFALPGKGLPPLKYTHQISRQRGVTHEERAQADLTCDLEHFCDLGQYFIALRHLPDDADLHVVDDERGRFEIDSVFDCLWNAQAKRMFHGDEDRKSTRLNSSHSQISYAVFCL